MQRLGAYDSAAERRDLLDCANRVDNPMVKTDTHNLRPLVAKRNDAEQFYFLADWAF